MANRELQVLDVLQDWGLSTGNLLRLQIVQFGRRGTVVVELREQIRTAPGSYAEGLTKGWRVDQVEWLLRHGDDVVDRIRRAKAMVYRANRIDPFQRLAQGEE